jgi:hypothetical protein
MGRSEWQWQSDGGPWAFHGSNAMATPDHVERAIAASFPAASRADNRAALSRYTDREVTRVHLAILALADGDPDQVLPMVEAACRDYQDVLYWAEWPEESSFGKRTRAEMAERYRRLGVPVPESLQ